MLISTEYNKNMLVRTEKQSKLLADKDFYKLILIYRWVSLIPAIVALLTSYNRNALTFVFFLLAIASVIWQSGLWWVSQRSGQESLKPPAYFKITVDLSLCIVLVAANGIWNSPYYLFALGLIFEAAYFYGLLTSVWIGVGLTLGYIIALINSIIFTGQGGNWVVSLTNISGFILYGLLFGYQSSLSHQLKEKTALAEVYRQRAEEHNRSLLQINQDLEEVRRFSEMIQGHTEIQTIYRLAICQLLTFEAIDRAVIGLVNEMEVTEWLICGRNGEMLIQPSAKFSPVRPEEIEKAIQQKGKVVVSEGGQQLISLQGEGEAIAILLITSQANQPLAILALLADQLGRTISNLMRVQKLTIEAERARLAMDMHDAVTQSLFGLAYSLDACIKLLPTHPHLIEQKLGDLRGSAFNTLSNLRNVIYDLWDKEDENQILNNQAMPVQNYIRLSELTSLIRRHIKNVNSLYSFPIVLELETAELKITAVQAKALYRVSQEALANAAKHADPTEVKISLKVNKNANQLELTVKDDGCGFNMDSDGQTTQLGLTTMQKRLEEAGGGFQLTSIIGTGTTVKLVMPFI